jgi:hypothetical protein
LPDTREFFIAEAHKKYLQPLKHHRYNTLTETHPDFIRAKAALRELIMFCTNDENTKRACVCAGVPACVPAVL